MGGVRECSKLSECSELLREVLWNLSWWESVVITVIRQACVISSSDNRHPFSCSAPPIQLPSPIHHDWAPPSGGETQITTIKGEV